MIIHPVATAKSGAGTYPVAHVEDAKKIAVVVTSVGTSVTLTVEASHDGTNWFAVEYVVNDSATAAVKTAAAVTVGGTALFVDGLDKRFFPYIRANVSASTGNYSIEIREV